jgi:hypothetical protein
MDFAVLLLKIVIGLAVLRFGFSILKRVLALLILRMALRAGLSSVGEEAMARQPDQIHLTPAPGHLWKNGAAVDALAAPLVAHGFEEAGTYRIEEMAGVVVRFLAHSGERIAACIYEHPKVGTWIDLVSRYRDDRGITYTTSKPTGLDQRPGTQTVHAPGTGADALYHRMLRERPAGELEEITPASVPALFVDAYARSTAWRKNKGVSADEVARNIQLAPVGAGDSSD